VTADDTASLLLGAMATALAAASRRCWPAPHASLRGRMPRGLRSGRIKLAVSPALRHGSPPANRNGDRGRSVEVILTRASGWPSQATQGHGTGLGMLRRTHAELLAGETSRSQRQLCRAEAFCRKLTEAAANPASSRRLELGADRSAMEYACRLDDYGYALRQLSSKQANFKESRTTGGRDLRSIGPRGRSYPANAGAARHARQTSRVCGLVHARLPRYGSELVFREDHCDKKRTQRHLPVRGRCWATMAGLSVSLSIAVRTARRYDHIDFALQPFRCRLTRHAADGAECAADASVGGRRDRNGAVRTDR